MKRIILPSVRMFVKVLRNYMYFMMHGMLSPDYPVDHEEEFFTSETCGRQRVGKKMLLNIHFTV